MLKLIFAVVAISSFAFGETANPVNHGNPTVPVNQTPVAAQQAAPDNSASLFLKLNACLAQRPGTGGSVDELLKAATPK